MISVHVIHICTMKFLITSLFFNFKWIFIHFQDIHHINFIQQEAKLYMGLRSYSSQGNL